MRPFVKTAGFCLLAAVFGPTATFLVAETLNLRLHSGERFRAEPIDLESEPQVFEKDGARFAIPGADIASQTADRGAASIVVLHLRDGRILEGALAREEHDRVTLENAAGFQIVPRDEIETITYREADDADPPVRYLIEGAVWADPETPVFGIVFHGVALGGATGRVVSATGGASVLYEHPAEFLYGLRPGLELGYRNGGGTQPTLFFSEPAELHQGLAFAYAHWRYFAGPYLDFYMRAGLGVTVNAFRGPASSTGANATLLFTGGWQGLRYGALVMRLGIRAETFFASNGAVPAVGFEWGATYAF